MRVFRLNAVGKDGKPLILGTADTAATAIAHLHDALDDYPRAWVTNEHDEDVSLSDLLRLSDNEKQNGKGS